MTTLVAAALLGAACAEERPVGIALYPPDLTLTAPDEVRQVRAMAFDQHGRSLPPARTLWKSSRPEVAEVDAHGRVRARGSGEAVITAARDAAHGQAALTGTVPVRVTLVRRVEVEPARVELAGPFASADLVVRARDEHDRLLAGLAVTFATGDPRVALVSSEGRVAAVRGGATRVRVTVSGVTTEVPVEVRPTPVKSLAIAPDAVEMAVTEARVFTVDALDPSGRKAPDALPLWSSSDDLVARVDADGRVEAVGVGQVMIAAAVGDVVATCNVTVTAR